jgi:hypothetical protein
MAIIPFGFLLEPFQLPMAQVVNFFFFFWVFFFLRPPCTSDQKDHHPIFIIVSRNERKTSLECCNETLFISLFFFVA